MHRASFRRRPWMSWAHAECRFGDVAASHADLANVAGDEGNYANRGGICGKLDGDLPPRLTPNYCNDRTVRSVPPTRLSAGVKNLILGCVAGPVTAISLEVSPDGHSCDPHSAIHPRASVVPFSAGNAPWRCRFALPAGGFLNDVLQNVRMQYPSVGAHNGGPSNDSR